MHPPPDAKRRPEGRRSGSLGGCGGDDEHTPPEYVHYGYRDHACGCADRLAHLERLVGQLCEHLDVDADLLEVLARPNVAGGHPVEWAEMVACGLDPTTGNAL